MGGNKLGSRVRNIAGETEVRLVQNDYRLRCSGSRFPWSAFSGMLFPVRLFGEAMRITRGLCLS